jgi:hypothetical protein
MTSKKFLELGIGLPLQQGSLDRLKERYASQLSTKYYSQVLIGAVCLSASCLCLVYGLLTRLRHETLVPVLGFKIEGLALCLDLGSRV